MRYHSKDGSVNETMILTALNKHQYKELSDNWKRHIKRMFKDIKDNDYIKANYYEFKDAKPDIVITVNSRQILLSIKSGHAPTMHYEPIKTFFDFLRGLGVPERIINIISFYHYGYSLKKGVIDHVLSREEILERFRKEIMEVNDFFDKHEEIIREIIYRAIIRGRTKRDLIDYLYYGNSSKGYLLSITDIINLITRGVNHTDKTLCFKQLTYVSCARNINNPRRHHIKINWPIMCKWFYDFDFMRKYG